MSLSPKEVREEMRFVLSVLLQESEDKWYVHGFLNRNDERVSQIHPTVWGQLKEQSYICDAVPGAFRLTALGWRTALESSGRKDDTDFHRKLGGLCASFKKIIDGRNVQAFTTVDDLSRTTNIEPHFIQNVIDSELVAHWFGQHSAVWAGPKWRGKLIVIPIDCGNRIMSVAL